MISDAQFLQWLRDSSSRITTLAEMKFGYQSASNSLAALSGNTYTTIPAQIPDSANNSITGDQTIDWFGSIASFAATANGAQGMLEKWDAVGTPNQRSMQLVLIDGGTPRFGWDQLGTGVSVFFATATATLGSVGIVAGQRFGLRCEFTQNNGSGGSDVRFYYSLDQGSTWTALGLTVTVAGTGGLAIFDGTAALTVNGVNATGVQFRYLSGARIYRAMYYSGLGATRVLKQDFNPATVAAGATTVADGVSGTWTIGADHSIVADAIPAEGTIYLSDNGYISKPADSPSNQRYMAAMMASVSFERSLDLARLGARGSNSVGEMQLGNADGALDFLLEAIIDGRTVSFYIGDASWQRADFRLLNVATIVSVKASSDTTMTIGLRDKNYLLDATIIGSPILSGPNVGKPRPVLLGYVYNFDVSPYLIDGGQLTYYVNDFAMSLPSNLTGFDVRDSGVSLTTLAFFGFSSATMTANAATDTLTFTAHGLVANDVVMFRPGGVATMFAGLSVSTQYWVINPTANTFQLSLTAGGAAIDITGTVMTGTFGCDRRRYYINGATATLQLSSSPVGRVTMDLLALDVTGDIGSDGHPHSIFRYILKHYTPLTSSDYDLVAIAAQEAIETTTRYAGLAILDRSNVMDMLDELAIAANSWYAQMSTGVLSVGKLDLQNLDSATAIDTIDEGAVEGDVSCENLPLQFGRIIYDAVPNVVTQTDGLASSVSASDRSKWAQAAQLRVKTTDPAGADYPDDWWSYHKTAIDSQPLATRLFQGGFANIAQAACDERTELFRPWTRVARLTVGLDRYSLNPGDCVKLAYPRYGLTAGKNFRVASVKPRPTERATDLVLVRRTLPDYTTSSHV